MKTYFSYSLYIIIFLYLLCLVILSLVLISKVSEGYLLDTLVGIANILIALFTAFAAYSAWMSTKISREQVIKEREISDRAGFFSLLDSLERSHGVYFTRRNRLYHEMITFEERLAIINVIEGETTGANNNIKGKLDSINRSKSGENINLDVKCTEKDVYLNLVDYCKCVMKHLNIRFSSNFESGFFKSKSGYKIYIDDNEKDSFVVTMYEIVSEVLSYHENLFFYNGTSIERSYYEAMLEECFSSFCEYIEETEYQYIKTLPQKRGGK
ncbi:hypothetical protein EHW59_15645 [Salinivibrio sp. VYel4]|nr:hypothetical protein [Salinivibrio sp. VYel4]